MARDFVFLGLLDLAFWFELVLADWSLDVGRLCFLMVLRVIEFLVFREKYVRRTWCYAVCFSIEKLREREGLILLIVFCRIYLGYTRLENLFGGIMVILTVDSLIPT